MEMRKAWCGSGIRIFLVAAAFSDVAFGQLQTVQIRVSGLDCASCAGSVAPRLKRLRGVAAAAFDGEKAVMTMAAENRVTLGAVRDALKGLGYTPGDAEMAVAGDVKDGRLSLPHQAEAFVLEPADGITGRVRVEGSVAAGAVTLRVRSVAKVE